MKTNRQVLIEAGVPADELDRIGCRYGLDGVSVTNTPADWTPILQPPKESSDE